MQNCAHYIAKPGDSQLKPAESFTPTCLNTLGKMCTFARHLPNVVVLTSGAMYLFVPTRSLGAMSTESCAELCRTAKPTNVPIYKNIIPQLLSNSDSMYIDINQDNYIKYIPLLFPLIFTIVISLLSLPTVTQGSIAANSCSKGECCVGQGSLEWVTCWRGLPTLY